VFCDRIIRNRKLCHASGRARCRFNSKRSFDSESANLYDVTHHQSIPESAAFAISSRIPALSASAGRSMRGSFRAFGRSSQIFGEGAFHFCGRTREVLSSHKNFTANVTVTEAI
jgi:hypothetical protein